MKKYFIQQFPPKNMKNYFIQQFPQKMICNGKGEYYSYTAKAWQPIHNAKLLDVFSRIDLTLPTDEEVMSIIAEENKKDEETTLAMTKNKKES